MNILWVKTDIIFPPNTGGKLRSYWILRELAKRHSIIYCCFSDSKNDVKGISEMKSWCTELHTIERKSREDKYTKRFYFDLLVNLLSRYPYAISKYYNRAFAEKIKQVTLDSNIDCIICDFIFPSLNMHWNSHVPKIIFCHNVETLIWKRYVENNIFLKKIFLDLQYKKMKSYEFSTLKKFNGIITVSDNDKRVFTGVIENEKIEVIGTGVNIDLFKKRDKKKMKPGNIVFCGSMDWIPNEDCVLYFVEDIYPIIRKEVPDANLTILGRKPTRSVKNLVSLKDKIEVTGTVEDVRPYMSKAGCFVVPLRIAGGTRLKIPEAMAMGVAVVSTSIGAEGLYLSNEKDILIEDNPQRFAEKVIRVLNDNQLREMLEKNGRATVEMRFSGEIIGEQFDKIINKFVNVKG